MEDMTKYWVWLVMVMGVANPKTMELVEQAESLKELYYEMHDPDCTLLTEAERLSVRRVTLEQSVKEMKRCEERGIGIMTWDSELYPDVLRHIYNPPALLFYKGDPYLLDDQMILTVVGTRNPSQYSLKVANWICSDLAKCNVILASGCAVGIDAAAHKAALAQGQPTIGVLGCGVDYDYPRENAAMKAQMLENGLLLSEYFPGTAPKPHHFPTRNRILSGISEGVLVVEAGMKSGALITANLACEQGKQVFCIPPANILDARYSGVINFLRDGAYPAFNYLDIVYTYYLQYPHRIVLYDEEALSRTVDSQVFSEAQPVKKASAGRRPPREKAAPVQETKPQKTVEPDPDFVMSPMQESIMEFLRKKKEVTCNELCEYLDCSFAVISCAIMDLRMQGLILNDDRDVYKIVE